MSTQEDFEAHWRASAHEAVPYSDELPECFLILPEWTDGAVAQGKATEVTIIVDMGPINRIRVIDNGKGATDRERLLGWANKESTDVHHRYGHGSKKCLTKFNKNYRSNWYVRYRTKDKRNNSGSLFTCSGPYLGSKTKIEEDENDETTLWPSGLEWSIEFDQDTLGKFSSPQQVFDIIKEVLRTRYSKRRFDQVKFTLTVNAEDKLFRSECSKNPAFNWKTFRECLDEEVSCGKAEITHDSIIDFNGIELVYTEYRLTKDGRIDYRDTLNKQFPIYGGKNMRSTKLHTGLDGRVIELVPMNKFTNKEAHNSDNGIIGFADFIGAEFNKMPTPCTTKVSFMESCPNYQKFREVIREHRSAAVCSCVKYNCDCGFSTFKKDDLDIHAKTHMIRCSYEGCDQTFTVQSEYESHKLLHKTATDYVCPVKGCKFSTELEEEFASHSKTHNKQCDIEGCSFSADTSVKLATHKKTHLIKCERCDYTCYKKEDLDTHGKTHKKKAISKKLKDEVWNKYIGSDIPKHKCMSCKLTTIDCRDFECGHVQAESRGGSQDIDNLRPICRKCNGPGGMGDTNMKEFVIKCGFLIG